MVEMESGHLVEMSLDTWLRWSLDTCLDTG